MQLTIRDNGPGIEAEQLKTIFDPFVTFKARGSGIGLALARRIITQLGGRIEAESIEGEGAEFRIVL
jgi:two-component system sensor histidine kinase AtoS